MDQRVTALINLQNCDNRIREIQGAKEEGPLKIQGLEEDLKETDRQLEAELGKLEEAKRQRREMERSIEDVENRIQKSNEKLTNIKSNKEYQAALKEIEGLGVKKTELEDRAIDIMEEIEILEEKNAAAGAERERLHEDFEKIRDEILDELRTLDQELATLEEERVHLSRNIDTELLKRYDRIRENKHGVAISPVVKGICQACHLGIPPQKFNELIRGEELMSCPNCMRIIYWGEDEGLKGAIEKD